MFPWRLFKVDVRNRNGEGAEGSRLLGSFPLIELIIMAEEPSVLFYAKRDLYYED